MFSSTVTSLEQRRIDRWEIFFKKYEKVKSTNVYVYPTDSWECTQNADNGELPKDLKIISDNIWEEDKSKIFSKHSKSDDDFEDANIASKDGISGYDSPLSDSSGNKDDDSYEDYESDFDSDEKECFPIGERAIFASLNETARSRSRILQERKEKLDRIFEALRAGKSVDENGRSEVAETSSFERTFVLSSKTLSPQKSSNQKSVSCCDGIGSTFGPTSPSPQDKTFSLEKSPLKPSPSAHRSRMCVSDSNSSSNNVKLTVKSNTSVESPIVEHLKRLKIYSPLKKPKKDSESKAIVQQSGETTEEETDDVELTPFVSSPEESRKRKISTNESPVSSRVSVSKPIKSRSRMLQEGKENLGCFSDGLGVGKTVREVSKRKTEKTSSIKRVFVLSSRNLSSKNNSIQESARSRFDGIRLTFASTSPSPQERTFSSKMSPSGPSRQHQLWIREGDGIPAYKNLEVTDKSITSKETPIVEALNGLKIYSPLKKPRKDYKSKLVVQKSGRTTVEEANDVESHYSASSRKERNNWKTSISQLKNCDGSPTLSRIDVSGRNQNGRKAETPTQNSRKHGTPTQHKRKLGTPTQDNRKLETSIEDNRKLGTPTQDKRKLGTPTQDNRKLETSIEDNRKFGTPTQDNRKLGTPTQDNRKLGTPTQDKRKLGTPTQDNRKLETSIEDNRKFGTPTQDNRKLGTPTQDNRKLGTLIEDNRKFGTPTQDNRKLGTPTQDNRKLGTPTQDNRKLGTPTEDGKKPETGAPTKDVLTELISQPSSTLSASLTCSGKIIKLDSSALRRRTGTDRKYVRAMMKGRSIFEL